LLVAVPGLTCFWTVSLSFFSSLCLEALDANSTSTQSMLRKRFAGAWLLYLALPAVAACLIFVSFQSGHALAAFLVLPAVGIWFPALEMRVIRRFMKVREWSTLNPSIDVSDLAASTRMPGTRVMLWESDEPGTEASVCNAMAMGLGSARSIFVFDGLLRILDHAQIRAIVAHEFAHHACRHHRKSLIATSAFTAVCTWVAVLASSDAREDVALIGMLVFACGGPLLLRAMSRAHEYGADRRAAELVPAEDLASALEVMDRQEPEVPENLFRKLLSTHPPIQRRISRLRASR
jgi:STE24 endopeptidase